MVAADGSGATAAPASVYLHLVATGVTVADTYSGGNDSGHGSAGDSGSCGNGDHGDSSGGVGGGDGPLTAVMVHRRMGQWSNNKMVAILWGMTGGPFMGLLEHRRIFGGGRLRSHDARA